MEEITENILLDNGFKNDGTNVFSYIVKDYAIEVYYAIDVYHSVPIKGRHWFCVVYVNDGKYILSSIAIQTIEQFNNLMDLVEVNFKLKK